MKTMRVWRYNDSSSAPALVEGTAEVPVPSGDQLLIRIQAAGVTPTELKWYPTTHTLDGGVRTGAIPGHEFAGVVEARGPQAGLFPIGLEVFGMNDWFADGTAAEFCLTTSAAIAPRPANLSAVDAASVPIGALTAWQALFTHGKLQAGDRVLIHGGAGAVGFFAIQLAHRAGASVITTASPRNFEYLTQLGADELIDYKADCFEKKASNLDVIFDTVGGETLRRSWSLLKPDGRMVTIAADSEGTKDERIEKAFFIVEPNGEQLAEIAQLLADGSLQTCIDAEVPMDGAADAYGGRIQARKGRGKAVLVAG